MTGRATEASEQTLLGDLFGTGTEASRPGLYGLDRHFLFLCFASYLLKHRHLAETKSLLHETNKIGSGPDQRLLSAPDLNSFYFSLCNTNKLLLPFHVMPFRVVGSAEYL